MNHLSLEEYYLESMRRCEKLTKELVEEVSTIVPSINALGRELWLSEANQRLHKTQISSGDATLMAESHLVLAREISQLIFSVKVLTKTVKSNISESLISSNTVLQNGQSVEYPGLDPLILHAFHQYQKTLIKSISVLDGLDEALLSTETKGVGQRRQKR